MFDRYSCIPRTWPRNSSFDFGAAFISPSAESMITEYASWLSPATFMVVPGRSYFFRFQIAGMSVAPRLSSIGSSSLKYLVRLMPSSRPRPQSGTLFGYIISNLAHRRSDEHRVGKVLGSTG